MTGPSGSFLIAATVRGLRSRRPLRPDTLRLYRMLWKHEPNIHIVSVEPAESAVLSGNSSGSHNIEGIGIGFLPPLWNPKLVNEIMTVSTAEAKTMARRLAQEEGIFAGTSSGANVVAALRVAQQLGPGAKVVTLIIDSGLRYLSTDVYR